MNNLFTKTNIRIITAGLMLLVVLMPQINVLAQTPTPSPTPTPSSSGLISDLCSNVLLRLHPACVGYNTVGVVKDAIGSYLGIVSIDIVRTLANLLVKIVLSGVGYMFLASASVLERFITYTTFFPPVLYFMWTIVRNFVNLFFILILLIIAFGTIFDNPRYNYKELLPKLIIAALLINFSFLIGRVLIDVSNLLSSVFLNSVGSNVGQIWANGFGASKLIATNGSGILSQALSVEQAGIKVIITVLFSIILIFVGGFTMLIAGLMALIRIPVLWFLLVVSPIAWIASILPTTRQWTTKWWQEFLSWTFFMPIYLFSMMFGIGFIVARAKYPDFNNGIPNVPLSAVISDTFGIQDLFFYIITLIFIGGGLIFARKAGNFLGGSATRVAGRVQGSVQRAATRVGRGAGYVAYRGTGARNVVEGTKQGIRARFEEIKERGLPVGDKRLFSQQNRRATTARIAETVGGASARGAVNKAVGESVSKAKEQFKNIKSEDELRNRMNQTTNNLDKLALAERLKEEGALNPREALETYKLYVSEGADIAAQQFAKGIDFSKEKMLSTDRARWDTDPDVNDPIIRRKIEMAKADSGDYGRETAEQLRRIATIFGQDLAAQKDFFDKVGKFNFEAATEAKVLAGIAQVSNPDGTRRTAIHPDDVPKVMETELNKMNIAKILDLSDSALRKLLAVQRDVNGIDMIDANGNPVYVNPEAARTITKKITPASIKTLVPTLNGAQEEILKDIIKAKTKEAEDEEASKLQKQAAAQNAGMGPLADAIKDLARNVQTQTQSQPQAENRPSRPSDRFAPPPPEGSSPEGPKK